MEPVEIVPWAGALQIHRYVLENGLRALIVPDPSAPVFSFNAWMEVGSRNEVPGRTGLAHLFEHLMFKETTNLAEGEFDKRMEAMGASTNAGTYYDWTFYTEALAKQHLDVCLQLEADRMQNMVLNDHQLETEREVVKNERLLRVENDPEGAMNEALWGAAFRAHSYRWPVIGYKPDLDAITLQDCVDFYATWYAPDQAALVLVGDLDPAETIARIQHHYGALKPASPPPVDLPVEPEPTAEQRLVLTRPIAAEIALVGYRVPAYSHEDSAALEVLNAVLFDGPSSRVERRLVGDLQLATRISSYVGSTRDPGLWEIMVHMSEGVEACRAEAVLYDELDRVRGEAVTPAELERAVAKLEASTLRGLRTAEDKAFQVGFHEMVVGNAAAVTEVLEKYRRVSRGDLTRVARAYLDPRRRSVVVARPPREVASTATSARLAETLPGGMRVLVEPSADLPMASVRLVLRAGAASDPDERPGLTNLVMEMLLRGTRKRSREQFEEAVDDLGGRMAVNMGRLTTTLGGEVPARNLGAYLSLVLEALDEPAFDEDQLDKLRRQVASEVLESKNDDGELAGLFLRAHLLGEGPMGRDIRGTLPSLASVHVDEVRSHYRSLLCRAAVVAGVAGDADPAAVREALATGLGDLRDGAVREPPPDPEARAPGRRLLLVDKPERSQVHYAIGQVGVPASHPDWVALRIAETAFGGTFTSVLMQEIREKRGWSYGVYSGEPRSRLPDVYQMVAYPSAEDAPACLALNLELFEAHCRGELDDEAIEAARSYLLGRAPFLVDTYEKRLDRNLEVDLLGLHPEFWTTYPDKVAATSAEDVRDALRRHRRPDDLSVVVVCTAEGMPERLEAAGLEFDEVQQIPYDHAGFGLEGPPSA